MTKSAAQKARNRQYREYNERNAHVISHFIDTYGRDETKLDMWQRFCRDVGVDEKQSINQCKKALKRTYINIFDFVEAYDNDEDPKVFHSYKALQNYILNNPSKRFPINKAKEHPILKWMLIEI